MSKYDYHITELVHNGVKVGSAVRKRNVEQYAQEQWEFAKLRKLFNDSIKNTKNIYRTPIFDGPRLVDLKEEK